MDLFIDGDRFHFQRLFDRRKVESVSFRVLQNMQHREKPGHVGRGLPWEMLVKVPEVVKVIDALGPDASQHAPLPAVVPGKNRGPVSEHLVEFLEVGDSRAGGFLGVHPFVDPVIPF